MKLSGVINEDNDLADHLEQIVGSLVAIDLSEVDRINPCGVRDWVNWIHALEAKGATMLFLECSPSIVAQINLVNNFTGSGHIKSLYLPYYCESCNEESTLLYEAKDLAPEQLPPVSRCNSCQHVMDFDDMPESYFAFLANSDRLLTDDTLTQRQRLAISKKSGRTTPPVFAIGSTPLPDIDELLQTSTREAARENAAAKSIPAESDISESAIALSTNMPSNREEPAKSNKTIRVVLPIVLLGAAVIAAYLLA